MRWHILISIHHTISSSPHPLNTWSSWSSSSCDCIRPLPWLWLLGRFAIVIITIMRMMCYCCYHDYYDDLLLLLSFHDDYYDVLLVITIVLRWFVCEWCDFVMISLVNDRLKRQEKIKNCNSWSYCIVPISELEDKERGCCVPRITPTILKRNLININADIHQILM